MPNLQRPALLLSWIFITLTSFIWGQKNPIEYLMSDEFNPNHFEKNIKSTKLEADKRQLLKAYQYHVNGELSEFNKTMASLIKRNKRFDEDPIFRCFFHLEKSIFFEDKGQFESAKREALLSQLIANSSLNKNWEAWSYARLGRLYSKENNRDSSAFYHKKSIEFAKRSAGKLTLALALHEFAVSNNRFLQVEQAVNQELLALELVQKIKNDYYTSKFYQFIATLSLEAGNLRESENYLFKSNQKNKRNANRLIVFDNELLNFRLLLKKSLPGEVVTYLPKTLKSLEKYGIDASLGEAWLIYGQALSSNRKSEDAMRAFAQAIHYFEQHTLALKMAETYFYIGLDYSRNNSLMEAEKQFQKSINIYNNLHDLRGLNDNYYAVKRQFWV